MFTHLTKTRKLKVNIFCDYCPFSLKGGIEKALISDIQHMKKKYDVHIFTTCTTPSCRDLLCRNSSSISFHIVNGNYETKLDVMIANVKFLFKILKASRDICFQFVHFHSNRSGFPAFIASKMLKSRLVASVHFVWPFCVKGTLLKKSDLFCDFEYGSVLYLNIKHCINECFKQANFFEKLYVLFSYFFGQVLIRGANHIICSNKNARKRLLRLGINAHKIHLVYIPVNVEKAGEIEGKEFRLKLGFSEEKMVLYAGRICAEKGLENLISAIILLPECVKLVIAGKVDRTNEYFKRLCRLIKKGNLEKRVIFVGFLDKSDLSSAYAACDVFVYPTLCYEMFGTSAMEALMFRKPVVVSNFGGMASLLENNRAALVEPGNVLELSKALSRCLFDSSYANEIATNGLNFVNRLKRQAHWNRKVCLADIYENRKYIN